MTARRRRPHDDAEGVICAACHRKRMDFEKNLHEAGAGELKRKLYHAFATLGLGREVQIIAKKL